MTSTFCLRRLPSTEMAHSSLVKCNLFWCSVSLHLTAKPFEQNSQQNWRLAIFNQSSRTRRFKLNFSAVSSNVLLLEKFKTLSLKFSTRDFLGQIRWRELSLKTFCVKVQLNYSQSRDSCFLLTGRKERSHAPVSRSLLIRLKSRPDDQMLMIEIFAADPVLSTRCKTRSAVH